VYLSTEERCLSLLSLLSHVHQLMMVKTQSTVNHKWYITSVSMSTYNLKIYKFANICWQSFEIIVGKIKCSQSLCNKQTCSYWVAPSKNSALLVNLLNHNFWENTFKLSEQLLVNSESIRNHFICGSCDSVSTLCPEKK